MGLIYSVTASFLLFIVLWSLSFKQFDAFLISMGFAILAAVVWKVLSYFTPTSVDTAGHDRHNA
jgi:hypothetical protein